MSQKIAGLLAGLLTGYLLGMLIGFVLFKPDQDMWAMLGAVLAVLGMGLGLTPPGQRHANVLLLALIGFYFGTLIGISLFGDATRDDLLEVLQRPTVIVTLIGTMLGGLAGWRLRAAPIGLALIMALLGGFLGGYVLGIALQLAPFPSFVGWSPFVIGCGVLSGGLVVIVQRRPQTSA